MKNGRLSISLQEATGFSPWSFIFDTDTDRVIKVFTNPKETSIDVHKHPLYVVFFKPIGMLLNRYLNDAAASTLLVASFAGAVAILFAFIIFLNFGLAKLKIYL